MGQTWGSGARESLRPIQPSLTLAHLLEPSAVRECQGEGWSQDHRLADDRDRRPRSEGADGRGDSCRARCQRNARNVGSTSSMTSTTVGASIDHVAVVFTRPKLLTKRSGVSSPSCIVICCGDNVRSSTTIRQTTPIEALCPATSVACSTTGSDRASAARHTPYCRWTPSPDVVGPHGGQPGHGIRSRAREGLTSKPRCPSAGLLRRHQQIRARRRFSDNPLQHHSSCPLCLGGQYVVR